MPLRLDEIQEVQEITRQIAKKEIKTMGRGLEMQMKNLETKVTDLETKVRELAAETMDLKAETKKAIQAASAHVEISKKDKRR